MDVMEKNPQLRRPVGVLLEMSEDQRLREIEEKQEIYRMDQESRMDGAYSNGKEEGIKQGWEERDRQARTDLESLKRESARRFKAMGLSLTQIAEGVGLSPEEIEKL